MDPASTGETHREGYRLAQYAREPRAYELMAILLPELAEDDLTAAIDQVSTHVGNINGEVREILKDSPWGRRRLAYSIRFNGQDYRDGYYVIWHFSADPGSLSDLERELKLDTRVIRYLLVLEDPKWGSPQERDAAREMAEAAAAAPAEAPAATGDDAAESTAATSDDPAEQPAEAAEVTTDAAPAEATSEPAAEAATEAPVEETPAEEAPATEEPAAEAPAAEAETSTDAEGDSKED
jgi:small subunit ribosomal protein S6